MKEVGRGKEINKCRKSGVMDREDECKKDSFECGRNRGFKGEVRQWNKKGENKRQGRRRFCHFWNNGKCRYSDLECWYLHEESPECKFGVECKMRRCMYYYSEKESWWKSESYRRKNWHPQKEVGYREDWNMYEGAPWNCSTSEI